MKKVLFLSPAYPYGHLGPSNNCTVRVMEALAQTGKYEVYNVSFCSERIDSKPNYKLVEGVRIIELPYPEGLKVRSRLYQRARAFCRIPVFPLERVGFIWKFYKSCKELLKNEQFDLLISQYNPFESVICGALLKKDGLISKHIVFSWDVIYGKKHNSLIPKRYAIRRQRNVVNWIAKYTDKLVTLYSQKSFHEKRGDVPAAIGKRCYLGIPSITRHNIIPTLTSEKFIKSGKINFIYAGHIFHEDSLEYAIRLLNKSSYAERVNFILLCKEPEKEALKKLSNGFKGTIQLAGWVPIEELFDIYSKVDYFISFGGRWDLGIPGKMYDYMSFGKPIIHFYKIDNDANLTVFAPYPLFKGIDSKKTICENKDIIEQFLKTSLSKHVELEEVEKLFPYASMSAYLKLIDETIA